MLCCGRHSRYLHTLNFSTTTGGCGRSSSLIVHATRKPSMPRAHLRKANGLWRGSPVTPWREKRFLVLIDSTTQNENSRSPNRSAQSYLREPRLRCHIRRLSKPQSGYAEVKRKPVKSSPSKSKSRCLQRRDLMDGWQPNLLSKRSLVTPAKPEIGTWRALLLN